MRITLNIVAFLLVLAGATWFLQGINVLPGSFMTGQIRWAIYGLSLIHISIENQKLMQENAAMKAENEAIKLRLAALELAVANLQKQK